MKRASVLVVAFGVMCSILVGAANAEAHQRDTWYIGFGLGGASGHYTVNGQEHSFKDALAGSYDQAEMGLNFKVGSTLNPRLLLGLDITGDSAVGSFYGYERSITVSNLFLVATYFPNEVGFFVRGGGGLSTIRMEESIGWGVAVSEQESGFGLLAGAGYAFWLGRTFNLTLNLDLTRQFYSGGPGSFDDSSAVLTYIGFDWY